MTLESPGSLLGTLVDGRYVLGEQVGHGGFGKVFRAEDLYGGPCAVKLIPCTHWADRTLAQREAAWLEESAHPGLVAFRGAGRFGTWSPGFVYIAMELGAGSLHEHLQKSGPMSAAGTRDLVLGLLDALDHLHARGLVHGDVKPGNLVRVADRWKLCDLGSASAPGTHGRTERDPRWSGTPEFMAPEVFDGEVGPAADLWSVGLLIHECATGKSPFPVLGAGHEAIERIVKETDPLLAPSLPAPLAAIVAGCLARDPARRSTAAQVREALATPISEPPPPTPRSWGRWVGVALVWGVTVAALVWEVARG